MPEGRGTKKQTKRKRKSTPATPEGAEVTGALIRLIDTEGAQARQVQALGSVTMNELPTLLRLAAKDVERELGIE